LIGERFKPGAVAQLTHTAVLVGEVQGHPQHSNQPLKATTSKRMGLGLSMPNTQGSLGIMSSESKKRRSPGGELPKPIFGVPAGGRQCTACEGWFPQQQFWRGRTQSFVRKCLRCSRSSRRNPNTGNSGMKKQVTPIAKYPNRIKQSCDACGVPARVVNVETVPGCPGTALIHWQCESGHGWVRREHPAYG
jgi:hypothetical protein